MVSPLPKSVRSTQAGDAGPRRGGSCRRKGRAGGQYSRHASKLWQVQPGPHPTTTHPSNNNGSPLPPSAWSVWRHHKPCPSAALRPGTLGITGAGVVGRKGRAGGQCSRHASKLWQAQSGPHPTTTNPANNRGYPPTTGAWWLWHTARSHVHLQHCGCRCPAFFGAGVGGRKGRAGGQYSQDHTAKARSDCEVLQPLSFPPPLPTHPASQRAVDGVPNAAQPCDNCPPGIAAACKQDSRNMCASAGHLSNRCQYKSTCNEFIFLLYSWYACWPFAHGQFAERQPLCAIHMPPSHL